MLQAIGTATLARRASLMPAATWLQASALRLDTTTRAPCSASRSAIALPMPFVEPVTSATFPVRSKRVIAILYQRWCLDGCGPASAGSRPVQHAGQIALLHHREGLVAGLVPDPLIEDLDLDPAGVSGGVDQRADPVDVDDAVAHH